ncbi:GPI transamidase component PIG-S [Protopterus annectens]|uniref:GPI transamidase component PIG-S n=1 Tax=Protopterus annectens TaxID=7888 RepID=UPI001CFBA764|nr:GPI transamidase component PIG-S [Protopterus annectens]
MASPMAVLAVEAEKTRGKYAAISIAVIVTVIGLPLWWKTTETYRASLPYSQISELDSLWLELKMPVEVVFAKGSLSLEHQRRIPTSLLKQTEQQLNMKTGFRRTLEIKCRMATVMEEEALKITDVEGMDKALQLNSNPPGSVGIYIVPGTSSLPQDIGVYIGKHRTAVLHSVLDKSKRFEEAMSNWMPRVEEIVQVMSFSNDDLHAALLDRISAGQFSKETFADSMRAFKSSLGYEITFSLLNPDPKSHNLHWDIETAVKSYIQPFLEKLSSVASFSVDSQILYYAILGVVPRFDKKTGSYNLNAYSLPHVINPVEARLGSNAASLYPVLNFLLYVPEYTHTPLYIQDGTGVPIKTNAFHSPRWGGIMVYNVDHRDSNETVFPVHVSIDMVRVMEVFLTQLRLMLGIQKVQMPSDFFFQDPGNEGVTDWELDRLLWSRTVENIAMATTTLTSLAQLLDEIGNIVINDQIGSEVYKAVAAVKMAIAELEAGRLETAFQASRDAINSSEKAFFDPSLLHLLYFPDDQKFAIYIPLFLPMAVPIVLSLLNIVKEHKRNKGRKEPTKLD